jgi:uncharacterized protein YecT (DUF1311 family)
MRLVCVVSAAAALACAIVLAPRPAAAGSDCFKPASALSRLVCTDAAVAAEDRRLAVALAEALATLSAPGQKGLQAEQAAWLGYVAVKCGFKGPVGDQTTSAECVRQEWHDRGDALQSAVVMAGGRIFRKVQHFAAVRIGPDVLNDPEIRPGVVTAVVAYPQIDVPANTREAQWNRLIYSDAKRRLHWDSPDLDGNVVETTDFELHYERVYSNTEFISVPFWQSTYGHGAAHPFGETWTLTFLLRQGRFLTAEDLFDTHKGWAVGLAALCADELRSGRLIFGDGAIQVEDMAKVEAAVVEPKRWTLTHEGLAVQFQIYDVGSYADGEPQVMVPWAALAPYLNPHPGVTLPPPE